MLKVQALKVDQWLEDWDKVEFSRLEFKSEPPKAFYIFKINAKKLLELSGIYRRSLEAGKRREGVQREHDGSRLKQIEGYVREGYPLSKIKAEKRRPGDEEVMRRPGWLPTSIVINILRADDVRYRKKISPKKIIEIKEKQGDFAEIHIPDESFSTDEERSSQKTKELSPIEVIDGQHRLLSFKDFTDEELESYELPVVAFHGLDIGWQAYLFWTINICPKKISPSLAYDLYPLLRSQEWIAREGNHKIYIEARSQEIVDYLWMNKKSAWKNRIDMIGRGYEYPSISQSTFIKSLLTSFFKKEAGFFMPSDATSISLDVNLQASIVIHCWNSLRKSIESKASNVKWMKEIVTEAKKCPMDHHPAFASELSLLAQDQGVRVVNDLFSTFLKLSIHHFEDEITELILKEESSEELVNYNLKELENSKHLNHYFSKFTDLLSLYDFRSSKSEKLDADEKLFKQSLRGSSGYNSLKESIVKTLLANCKESELRSYFEMMIHA